jgi:transketolase
VLRPGDANETSAAWRVALERRDGPTVLVLSRQGMPVLDGPNDVGRGGYVLEAGDDCALIATGSEVKVAVAARGLLAEQGVSARVVSLPSWELFASQPAEYRETVLPSGMPVRVSVEAACSLGWHRWVGDRGAVVAIDRFGESAPGEEVLAALGVTPEAVAEAARRALGR